jgi:GTP-binding protein
MSKPIIALVGRPNVGKSTLFNRLSVRKKAIVHNKPGVTRDRNYADARLGPLEFTIVDTPGLEEAKPGELEHAMTEQAVGAIASADLVILVLDGAVGCTPIDKNFANLIRKHQENTILVLNKCEKLIYEDKEYFRLGMGDPIKVSAEHGDGMAGLCDELLEKLGDYESDVKDPFTSDEMQIAIVGRPNAGKSTFVNSLLDENRVLTGAMPGVTRDSIDIKWEYKNKPIKLVDTAGMRRKGNIQENLEKLSVGSTLRSIRYANTVILMLDATNALESQDLNIANLIINEGRALVIVINKWDLVKKRKEYKEELDYQLSKHLGQVPGVPVVYLSSIDKVNVTDAIDACIKIYQIWNKRITTSELNDWLSFVTEEHQLPLQKNGKRIRIKYMTQIKVRPPSFKVFSNYPDKIPDSYIRYLVNNMRECFSMPGIPIRITLGKSDNPYAKSTSNKKQ